MIALYPVVYHREQIPAAICAFFEEIETRGGMVGTPGNVGDAFDIVIESDEHPRKEKTKLHQYWSQKYEERKNGEQSDEEE